MKCKIFPNYCFGTFFRFIPFSKGLLKVFEMRYILFGFLLANIQIFAQDTIQKIEVKAYPYQKFAVGAKIWQADSLLLSQHNSSQLSEWLMRFSGIYLKEYGNGMLGAIALRGTGAGHTAVLWNGININSPTLGESDFVNIPIFSQSQVNVQFGAAASLFGSEAIGGAVLISGLNETNQIPQKLQLRQEVGSFGRNFSALSFLQNHEKIQVRASVYRLLLPNNYPIPALLGRAENQNSVNYFGASQDIRFQLSPKQNLTLHSWYHSNFRKLSNGATLTDNNLRLLSTWENNFSHTTTLQAKVGYTNDFMLYNRQDTTQTQRVLGILQMEKHWQKITLQAGLNSQLFLMNVDAYGEKRQEWRNDAFVLLRWQVLPYWTLSFNQRQTWVQGYQVPFTPSLGSEFFLKNTASEQIVWKMQAGRGYRVPTLNSRYWQPGGNPNIQPEHSLSAETGILWQQKHQQKHFSAEITAFAMQVKDWILWQPTSQGFWSPENLQDVKVRGFEGQVTYKYFQKNWQWHFWGNYTLTASQIMRLKNDVSGRFTNKFLPYAPLQKISVTTALLWQKWQITCSSHFTDQRFSDLDNSQRLKSFYIVDANLQRKFHYKQNELSINLQVNNILDKQYYNVLNQWMPPRNYQISVVWTLQ
jgi:iron complex outermembrane receptor protein